MEEGGVVDRKTTIDRRDVRVSAEGVRLEGTLALPAEARGLVIFAHGSGSSRFSSRNRFVADRLNEAQLGTLLIDLLTEREGAYDEATGALRFDIPLLGGRVRGAVDWARATSWTSGLDVGLFGASTGAAAALIAAADRPTDVHAVVSRGGRPDLAGDALPQVQAPTLLIVGSRDPEVLELNRQAAEALRVEQELRVVTGATHLFEEPGTLEEAARAAAEWFRAHLGVSAGWDTPAVE
jgi:putative phosphoribosyl transferase